MFASGPTSDDFSGQLHRHTHSRRWCTIHPFRYASKCTEVTLAGIGPEISESIKDIYTAGKVRTSEGKFSPSDNIPLGPNPMGGG